jgi:hypothetical protein
MESIMKDGLEAKKDLMSVEKSETLSKEQREQKICQIRLMDMVERAMVNSAYMDYMDKGKQPGMEATKMRSSRIFNAMEKNPDALKEKLYNDIKQLDSTNQLMGMSGKELSEFISEPTNVRNAQNEDMRKAVETRQAEREQAQQLTQQQQQPQMQQQQPQMQQQMAM